MILADTSVWIGYFRLGDAVFAQALDENLVVMHPLVLSELACANLRNRRATLSFLRNMPEWLIADTGDILQFIESQGLMGKGIGYVDVSLIASAALDPLELWTNDLRLLRAASAVGVRARISARRN